MERKDMISKNYIRRGIEYVTKNFKNRSAGSKAEKECQNFFKDELSKYADSVTMQAFKVRPKAFLGWITIAAVCSILSVVYFWSYGVNNNIIYPLLAIVTAGFAVLCFVFEFILYKKFVDFMFKEETSHNVFALRKSTEQPKRRIIFTGHADAPYEFRFILKSKHPERIVILSLVGLAVILLSNVILLFGAKLGSPLIHEGVWRFAGILNTVFIPVFAALFFFVNWGYVTDGANDNLSGCYGAISVLRDLSKNDMRFKNTEVGCLITGSEESGLRGAEAFARHYSNENDDIETVFVVLDTLTEIDKLAIYDVGMNGTQRNSYEVGELIRRAAVKCGYELEYTKPYLGSIDAEEFSRQGYHACGLCGVDHTPQTYYHTRHDTLDSINEDCIALCAMMCIEAAHIYAASSGIDEFSYIDLRGGVEGLYLADYKA